MQQLLEKVVLFKQGVFVKPVFGVPEKLGDMESNPFADMCCFLPVRFWISRVILLELRILLYVQLGVKHPLCKNSSLYENHLSSLKVFILGIIN